MSNRTSKKKPNQTIADAGDFVSLALDMLEEGEFVQPALLDTDVRYQHNQRKRAHYRIYIKDERARSLSRQKAKRYYLRKQGNFSNKEWEIVKQNYDNRCAYCGQLNQKLEIEHVVPVSKGGLHNITNIVPACRECNARKGGRTPEEANMIFRVVPSK